MFYTRRLLYGQDFFVEAEAVAVKMASLRAADWLRARVSELEVDWSRVNSALSKLQELLQQRLLDRWPPVRILPDLQAWFQGLETRLIHDKETPAEAENAARLVDVLQNYQVCLAVTNPGSVPDTLSTYLSSVFQGLKVAMTNAQILLEFLSQPGPQLVGEDAEVALYQRTVFAEQIGDLRLRCQLLLTDVGTQVS